MGKENFIDRVEAIKRQIANEKLEEERKEQRWHLEYEEKERNKRIQEQIIQNKKREETLNVFKGTNIIETLEYIRDAEIFVYDKYEEKETVCKKGFFGDKYRQISKWKNIPMVIGYNLNSVTAVFNSSVYSGDGESHCLWEQITVTKKDNLINFNYSWEETISTSHGASGSDQTNKTLREMNVSSSEPNDTIDGIARVVALYQR